MAAGFRSPLPVLGVSRRPLGPVQAGYRSLFAFWGGSAVLGTPVVERKHDWIVRYRRRRF
jgi:hypothetical protein